MRKPLTTFIAQKYTDVPGHKLVPLITAKLGDDAALEASKFMGAIMVFQNY